jgi:hypothetical protein
MPKAVHLEGWLADHAHRNRAKRALGWSIAITALLYVIPFGGLIAYPLVLLSTLFHELGHGVAALATGGSFEQLAIYGDGSGVATHGASSGAVAQAIVAAGGLVGPAIVAAIAFAMGRRAGSARGFTIALAIGLALALALVVRNPFGMVFVAGVTIALGWIGVRKNSDTAQLALVFLAVQLALSVFSRGDYLFTEVAMTGAGAMPSDTAHIAMALGGPYWAWGLACGAFSVLVLAAGVWSFTRALEPRPLVR